MPCANRAIARFHNDDRAAPTAAATWFTVDHVLAYLEDHKTRTTELSCRQVLDDPAMVRLLEFFNENYESFHLSILRLPKNNLTSQSSEALTSAYQAHISSLRELDLSENPAALQGGGLNLLIGAMVTDECRLTHLNLNKNRLGNKREGPHAIGRLLRLNTTIKELLLSHNNISSHNMKEIAKGLCQNATIRRLVLSYNKISDQGVGRLMASLDFEQSACELNDLDLTYNKISSVGAEHIATLLNMNNKHITKLNLSLNAIGPQGASFFQLSLQYNHTLLELNLSRNNILDDGATAIAQGLLDSDDTKLHTLDLSWNSLTNEGASSLAHVLREKSILRSLKLASNAIGDEGMNAIADALHSDFALKELDIVGNQMRNPSGFIHLVCYGSYTLQHLAFAKNNMSTEQEARVMDAFQFRENNKTWLGKLLKMIAKYRRVSLNLQSKDYGDEEIVVLAKQLSKYGRATITTATFDSPKITDRGLCTLANEVLSNCRAAQVQRLYLYGCTKFSEKAVRAVASALKKKHCPLICLCLNNCNIGDKGAEILSDAIQENKKLTRFSVESNAISDAGARSILSVALDPPHPSLVSLNLAKNQLTDEALSSLKPLIGLEELHLDGNYLTDISALDLAKSVMGSDSIVGLNLRRNRLSARGIQALELFLPDSFVLDGSDQRQEDNN